MKYSIIETYPFFEDEEVKRIPLRKLGELTGVHYTYLNRLKNGQAVASPEMMERLKVWLNERRKLTPATLDMDKYENERLHGMISHTKIRKRLV